MVADLRAARVATRALFASFDQEMLDTLGLCWKYEMQVLAMGFNIIGHQVHHFRVLGERYYPLAEQGKVQKLATRTSMFAQAFARVFRVFRGTSVAR